MGQEPVDFHEFFAAPASAIGDQASVDPLPDLPQAVEKRRLYRRHEGSIKAMGIISYMISSLFALVVVVAPGVILGWYGHRDDMINPNQPNGGLAIAIGISFYVVIAAFWFLLGQGLRRLQTWARFTFLVPVILALLGIGLYFFASFVLGRLPILGPMESILGLFLPSAFLLYCVQLVLRPEAGEVFSPFYRQVVAATPEISDDKSLFIKLLLFLFGAFFSLMELGVLIKVFSD